MKFEISILPSKVFDELPYNGINQCLGIADVERERGYIRKTGDPREDLDSLIHEVNEFIYPNKWDEIEPGIYAKKWYQTWWGRLLPLAAGAALAPFTGGTSMAWLPVALGAGIGGARGYKAHDESIPWGLLGATEGGALSFLGGKGASAVKSGVEKLGSVTAEAKPDTDYYSEIIRRYGWSLMQSLSQPQRSYQPVYQTRPYQGTFSNFKSKRSISAHPQPEMPIPKTIPSAYMPYAKILPTQPLYFPMEDSEMVYRRILEKYNVGNTNAF
jgi:hypothetical protein